MLVKKQAKFAQDIAKLIKYIEDQGDHCTLAEAYRTQEQADLYAQQGKGIKNSLHRSRLAIDLCIFNSAFEYQTKADYYKKYAEYWLTLDPDNKSGHFFTKQDSNHFEVKAP